MTADDTSIWTAWTDGSAAPNPGPMGLGVVLCSPQGVTQTRSMRVEGRGCNNEAELRAILLAVHMAREAGAQQVRLYTDSRIAADHLQRIARPPSVPMALMALIAQIAQHTQALRTFTIEWIPGRRNAQADQLSRAAVGLPDAPDRYQRSPGKRRRKR